MADQSIRQRFSGLEVVTFLRDVLNNGTRFAPEVAIVQPSADAALRIATPAASPLPVAQTGRTILATAAQSVLANGNTADLDVSLVEELAIDLAITTALDAGATVQFFYDRKMTTGQYAQVAQTAALSGIGVVSLSLGSGMTSNVAIGNTGRLRWVVTGAPTVGVAALSITGK